MTRLLGAWLVSLVLFLPQAFSQNKPTVVISPLKGKNAKPALDAISSEFRGSNRVFVIDLIKVLEYLDSKGGSKNEGAIDEAAARFETGKQAYLNLKLDEAIENFSKASELYRLSLSNERSFDGFRSTKFHLAMSYLAKDQKEKAQAELRDMIILDPKRDTTQLSEKYFSPKIRELYKVTLKEVKAMKKGNVRVNVLPAGTAVFMDGVNQGSSPLDLQDVPVGVHYFRLVAQTGQEEVIEKSIVEGANELDLKLDPGPSSDPMQFFGTLPRGKELDQERATYLDEMGLTLGADIFVFLTPLQGQVKGQLYDQRSQELSREEADSSPQGLVNRLLKSLSSDGYVIPANKMAADEPEAPQEPIQSTSGIELKPKSNSAGIDYKPAPTLQAAKKPWYKNKWVWIGIGAGLAGAGAGAYFLANQNNVTSTITLTIP